MCEDRTLLFGLPGFRVGRVERDQFGGRTVHVQTDDETAAGCSSCGGAVEVGEGPSQHSATGSAIRRRLDIDRVA